MAIAMAVTAIGGFLIYQLNWPMVYGGITLEGAPIGGKTHEELVQLLKTWQQERRNHKVEMVYGEKKFRLDASEIDYDLDVEATVVEVWNFGRYGSLAERLSSIWTANHKGYNVFVHTSYDEAKLAGVVEKWRQLIDRLPRNATLSLFDGVVVPDEEGRRLEIETVKKSVVEALGGTDAVLLLPVTPLYPQLTKGELEAAGLKLILAQFTTYFDSTNVNRSANVALAANKINGYIIYPGQIFSFNEIVGPREKQFGFMEALEIVDGEMVPGIGGGVCQVSSTLYNAVLLANLAIVERTNHSKPLGYVGLGRDATVYYDTLDFKFVNNTVSPIMVVAEVRGDALAVAVIGEKAMTEQIKILSVDRRVIMPTVVTIPDAAFAVGESKVEKTGTPGYEITTIRVSYVDGAEVNREVVAKDSYSPDDTVIRVGISKEKRPPQAKIKPKQRVEEN
ncbi:MAG: VanW family protein [Firmicutes bacterium]|nr:VanW family protein [Bacillota bacterium]